MTTEKDTRCAACKALVKDWEGDDPKCAFTTGVFSRDNWMCATLQYLAQWLQDAWDNRGDDGAEKSIEWVRAKLARVHTFAAILLGEIDAKSDDGSQCLLVCYDDNDRREIESIQFMFDDGRPPRPPTEQECLAIAKAFGYGV